MYEKGTDRLCQTKKKYGETGTKKTYGKKESIGKFPANRGSKTGTRRYEVTCTGVNDVNKVDVSLEVGSGRGGPRGRSGSTNNKGYV